MKKLSIVIVNYNVCYFLEQILLSIRKATQGLDLEVIVVDNNSVDKSLEMVRAKFPEVELIANKVNVGFSKANNQAIRIAKGEYVLLLNPDTVLEEDTIVKCCQFMDEHPDGGGLGVMMLDGAGEFLPESKRGLPTPWVAFYKMFGLARLFPKSKKFGKYHLGYLDKNETNEIEVLSGAYMFLRKSVLDKVGLLDEDYFMYGEDIDLSYRINRGGYKNYYFPETRIIHYKGESTKRTSLNYVFTFYRAMIIFARKHFSNRSANVFSFLIHIAIYLTASVSMCVRVLNLLALPLLDGMLIFIQMYVFKNYYEANFRAMDRFPSEYIPVVVPVYILIWVIANYFSGGYDKYVVSSKIIRGALVGTLIISALSNFVDDYRYSKAMILFGTLSAIFTMLLVRMVINFVKNRTLVLGEKKRKRVVVIGSAEESERARTMLLGNNYSLDVIGYISPNYQETQLQHYLGHTHQISEILAIYAIDEIIFCSKDFSANRIIECMMDVDAPSVDYKILPDDSDYIIGSNSKSTSGEFYTLNLDLNIIKSSAKRNKRVLDIGLSTIFLLLSPLLMWFVEKPFKFVGNLYDVFVGKCSLVGYSDKVTVQLPNIKKGIINPASHIDNTTIDQQTINRLNLLYAKDYNAYIDIIMVARSFRMLG